MAAFIRNCLTHVRKMWLFMLGHLVWRQIIPSGKHLPDTVKILQGQLYKLKQKFSFGRGFSDWQHFAEMQQKLQRCPEFTDVDPKFLVSLTSCTWFICLSIHSINKYLTVSTTRAVHFVTHCSNVEGIKRTKSLFINLYSRRGSKHTNQINLHCCKCHKENTQSMRYCNAWGEEGLH